MNDQLRKVKLIMKIVKLAGQIAIAIRNARLVHSLRLSDERYELAAGVGRVLRRRRCGVPRLHRPLTARRAETGRIQLARTAPRRNAPAACTSRNG